MTQTMTQTRIDPDRLEEFAGKVFGDIGGAFSVLLSFIGDRTGVFRMLGEDGPSTPAELAERSGVDERYLTEWLSAQAAAGYVDYDRAAGTFSMTPEQHAVLAVDGHPAFLQGLMQNLVAQFSTHELAVETFRSGAGRGWKDHHACCFCGTDRCFRPGYKASLLDDWLPALDGVAAKLSAGGMVADVGCGLGSSTMLMAGAYPATAFHGFDFHEPSIRAARERAHAQSIGNIRFEALPAKAVPQSSYDLICLFDTLHDMGDPVGAARHLLSCLSPDGTLMVVEPLAGDSLSENMTLVGQVFYAASTIICTPASRAQEIGLALGAQAGEARLAAVLGEAGFSSIRRVAETKVNMVLEARP